MRSRAKDLPNRARKKGCRRFNIYMYLSWATRDAWTSNTNSSRARMRRRTSFRGWPWKERPPSKSWSCKPRSSSNASAIRTESTSSSRGCADRRQQRARLQRVGRPAARRSTRPLLGPRVPAHRKPTARRLAYLLLLRWHGSHEHSRRPEQMAEAVWHNARDDAASSIRSRLARAAAALQRRVFGVSELPNRLERGCNERPASVESATGKRGNRAARVDRGTRQSHCGDGANQNAGLDTCPVCTADCSFSRKRVHRRIRVRLSR